MRNTVARWLLVVIALGLFRAAPAQAQAQVTSVAIIDIRFTDVPPALLQPIRQRIQTTLASAGYAVLPERSSRRRLRRLALPPGCIIGPCLSRVGEALAADRVLLGGIAAEGTSYDMTFTLLETGGGSVLAQVNDRCDVCTFTEVEAAVVKATEALHRQALVLLSQKAVLRVKSAPSGASVLVDGIRAGQTPLTRVLPAGRHTVEVAAVGRMSAGHEVVLEAGKTRELNLTLVANDGASPPPAAPRDEPAIPGWVRWSVLGGGVALGGVGVGLLAVDGTEKADPRYVHDTWVGGVTLLSVGAAAALASVIYTLVERGRSSGSPARDAALAWPPAAAPGAIGAW